MLLLESDQTRLGKADARWGERLHAAKMLSVQWLENVVEVGGVFPQIKSIVSGPHAHS